jgi:excinuclease ABC subunit C
MVPEEVLAKLDSLPSQPGVYVFKGKKGEVLYVGKAKSLRSRVRSYFQSGSSDTRSFIPLLHRGLGDLDTIVTSTEKEATILENSLIKEYRPRYNVKLRDDKEFLSIRLGVDHAWPRLTVVRRPAADGARYFGPYHSATAARRTLHLINKHFQLRTCGDVELESRKRPCLQYQIKRCPAPCVYEVDPAWYGEQVRAVGMFLEGRHDELTRELEDRMRVAAREMRFELAAVYRDQLHAIEKVRESQRVVDVDASVTRDVIGLYREGDLVEIAVLHVRSGRLWDVMTVSVKNAEIPEEEIVAAFLAQHYGNAGVEEDAREGGGPVSVATGSLPEEIVLPCLPEGHEGIADWLTDRAREARSHGPFRRTSRARVALVHPKRGDKAELLRLANENARHSFLEKRRTNDDLVERLAQLKDRLRLPTIPHRIECVDISHLGGGDTVGAIVALKDGLPDKKRYRTFHVRAVPRGDASGGDDYAAMYEVLARRFRRGLKDAELDQVREATAIYAEAEGKTAPEPRDESDASWDLPDLLVVDGGRGQLGVALAAAHDLGLHGLSIVGLAKERENVMAETLVDRVYVPGQKNPIPLRPNSASLFFLARARDEAHRFSNRARERLGKARRFKSKLDDVPGLGPKTKVALLRSLGTVEAVLAASDDALVAVPGVTRRHVAAVRSAFGPPRAPVPARDPPSTEEPNANGVDASGGSKPGNS